MVAGSVSITSKALDRSDGSHCDMCSVSGRGTGTACESGDATKNGKGIEDNKTASGREKPPATKGRTTMRKPQSEEEEKRGRLEMNGGVQGRRQPSRRGGTTVRGEVPQHPTTDKGYNLRTKGTGGVEVTADQGRWDLLSDWASRWPGLFYFLCTPSAETRTFNAAASPRRYNYLDPTQILGPGREPGSARRKKRGLAAGQSWTGPRHRRFTAGSAP